MVTEHSAISRLREYADPEVGNTTTSEEDQAAARAMLICVAPHFNYELAADGLEAWAEALRHEGLNIGSARELLRFYDALVTVGGPAVRVNDVVISALEQRRFAEHAAGNKIAAIKALRERTAAGLKEAKDAIEAWTAAAQTPAPSSAASRPFRVGDKVVCPSGLAIGEALNGVGGVGTVVDVGSSDRPQVDWPSGHTWYHEANELELAPVAATGTTVNLSAAPTEPAYIEAARRGCSFSREEARDFLFYVLSDRSRFDRICEEVESNSGAYPGLRNAVSETLLRGTYLTSTEVERAVHDYNSLVGYESADKAAARKRIEQLERELAEAREELENAA